MNVRLALSAVLIAGIACGGTKEAPPANPAAGVPAPATQAGDTAAAGSASARPPRKDTMPMRDSAFGPIGAVDSTGKVVPIKRP